MIKRADHFTPSSTDVFFIDNNIWIMLLHPNQAQTPHVQRVKPQYETLISQIMSVGSTVVINSLLLSEYINRSLRLDHDLVKELYPNFKKDFKYSSEFKESSQAIAASIKAQILKVGKVVTVCDEFQSISDGFDYSIIEIIDFNDEIYFEMCKKNNYILITDDSDFKTHGSEISIVTANNKLRIR